jgi:hypothetical protein
MFLLLIFVNKAYSEYKLTGTVSPRNPTGSIFKQYINAAEGGHVLYVKERSLNENTWCVGILCGEEYTKFTRDSNCDPEYLVSKHCMGKKMKVSKNNDETYFSRYLYPKTAVLKYVDSLGRNILFQANDIPTILTFSVNEVYDGMEIPKFKRMVHRNFMNTSLVEDWSIYCVSGETGVSKYLNFHIDTSKDFQNTNYGIYFHYDNSEVLRFQNSQMKLRRRPKDCDTAFEMLLGLPEVRDVINKADLFNFIRFRR